MLRPDVTMQVARLTKAQPTHHTLVRPLLTVHQTVAPPHGPVRKRLPTILAPEGTLAGVRAQVDLEAGGV